MKETKSTFCRACHACCSVLVDIEDGQPVSVRGDKENTLYRGFCCIKGQNYAAQRNNPNRLLHSQKRQPDGSYKPIATKQALDEIAEKLKGIIAEYSPRAVAAYIGTFGSTSSSANAAMSSAWMEAIGSSMTFTSNTIDQPGKFVAAALFGRWMAPHDNFGIANVTLLIGMNPLVSMSGGIPHTNPGRHLTDALQRGMKLIVIDPRRSETARRAHVHLQPKPGQDVAILAALINVILSEALYDRDFVTEHLEGLDDLAVAVAPYTPENVEARAGVESGDIIEIARMFASNSPGVATAGTGPNMSGNTTLLEYLVLCLNTLCGRWAREGDRVLEPSTLATFVQPRAQAMAPTPEFAYGFGESLRVRGLTSTAAGLPTAALSDEILLPGEGQVRALISHGGNPVSVWPDQIKTVEALRSLDLSVQIDLTMSATAWECDYVIAAAHPLEMPGISLVHEYMSSYAPGFGTTAPWAQYTAAVVEPPVGSDVIEDWRIFYGIATRMNLELFVRPIPWSGSVEVDAWEVDMNNIPTTEDIFEKITEGSRVPLEKVMEFPRGAVFDEPPVFVEGKSDGWQGKFDAANPQMMAELQENLAPESDSNTYPYRLISRRQINVLNSTGHDIPGQVRATKYNPAYLNAGDLAQLGISRGDTVDISSRRGSVKAIVEIDNNLRSGIISMSHGWGNRPGNNEGVENTGSSTARLIDNSQHYERFTGLPRMSNIPVAIRKL